MASNCLLDQARKLISTRSGAAAVLAIMPLATVRVSAAQLTLDGTNLSYGSGGAYAGSGSISGQIINSGQSAKLYGNVGPIAGSDWPTTAFSELTLVWFGSNSQLVQNGDQVKVDYDFDLDFTGGTADWTVSGYQGYRGFAQHYFGWGASTQGTANASTNVTGSITSVALNEPGTITSNTSWDTELRVTWSSYSPSDSLTVTIPNNSIDFTELPEPTGLFLLPLTALGWAGVRRRQMR